MKNYLLFSIWYDIITSADLCNQIKIYKITLERAGFLEVSKWLSAVSAVRALPSDTMCLTLTVRPTEPGSPTFVELKLKLTALTLPFMFAPVAFAQERLSVSKVSKTLLKGRVF